MKQIIIIVMKNKERGRESTRHVPEGKGAGGSGLRCQFVETL